MANSDFSAIAETVPQVSYEIVGRITPGIVVILSLVVAALGPAQAAVYLDETFIQSDPAPNGWAVALMVIAAYVLAFAFDGIWQIPACVRRWREKPCHPDLQNPSASFKFDVVNHKLPKAGAWLTKLYAEANATQVLIIGWMIGVAINTYCLASCPSIERLWLDVCLIAGTIAMVMVRHSISLTRETTLGNLWVLLQEEASTQRTDRTAKEEKKGVTA